MCIVHCWCYFLNIQLRATLSSYIGEELEKMQENIDSVNQYFKTDDEEAGEKEEEGMEMLVEVQDILGELGKKIKFEKLLKVNLKIMCDIIH